MMESKGKTSRMLECRNRRYFKEKLERDASKKMKIQYHLDSKGREWEPGKREEYMNELTRNQAFIIFKARIRMIDVKNHFKE